MEIRLEIPISYLTLKLILRKFMEEGKITRVKRGYYKVVKPIPETSKVYTLKNKSTETKTEEPTNNKGDEMVKEESNALAFGKIVEDALREARESVQKSVQKVNDLEEELKMALDDIDSLKKQRDDAIANEQKWQVRYQEKQRECNAIKIKQSRDHTITDPQELKKQLQSRLEL